MMYLLYYDYGVLRWTKFTNWQPVNNYVMVDGKHLKGKEGGFIHLSQIHSVQDKKPIIVETNETTEENTGRH